MILECGNEGPDRLSDLPWWMSASSVHASERPKRFKPHAQVTWSPKRVADAGIQIQAFCSKSWFLPLHAVQPEHKRPPLYLAFLNYRCIILTEVIA